VCVCVCARACVWRGGSEFLFTYIVFICSLLGMCLLKFKCVHYVKHKGALRFRVFMCDVYMFESSWPVGLFLGYSSFANN
jgi:hypothetical protein